MRDKATIEADIRNVAIREIELLRELADVKNTDLPYPLGTGLTNKLDGTKIRLLGYQIEQRLRYVDSWPSGQVLKKDNSDSSRIRVLFEITDWRPTD